MTGIRVARGLRRREDTSEHCCFIYLVPCQGQRGIIMVKSVEMKSMVDCRHGSLWQMSRELMRQSPLVLRK